MKLLIGDDVYHPGHSTAIIGRVIEIETYPEVTLIRIKSDRNEEYLVPESELKKLGESTNDVEP